MTRPLIALAIAAVSLALAPSARARQSFSWSVTDNSGPVFYPGCTDAEVKLAMQSYEQTRRANGAYIAALQKQIADLQRAVERLSSWLERTP